MKHSEIAKFELMGPEDITQFGFGLIPGKTYDRATKTAYRVLTDHEGKVKCASQRRGGPPANSKDYKAVDPE